jgi:Fe-S cluster assembly scaffold protein SufB
MHEAHHKTNHGTSVVVRSTKLCRIFEQLAGSGCEGKYISNVLMHAPKAKQQQLLLGWFRGDGNYYRRQHKYGLKEVFRLCTVSPVLAQQGRQLLMRLQIASSLNIRQRSHEGRKDMHTLVIGGQYLVPFGAIVGHHIQSQLHHKKRATYYHLDDKYLYAPVSQITQQKVTNIPVHNFSVKDDESYTVSGVAVHNCTAPAYSSESLHSAVVEIIVKPGARVQYTTVQNWYKTVYNLVTKRARVEEEAEMIWTDFNMGCLTADTKIFVKNKGVQPISQVKTGDFVYSLDLNTQQPILAKVSAAKKTGIKPVFRLKTENARIIEATGNHPFLVMTTATQKNGYSTLQWKPLSQIKLGERIGIIRGLPNNTKAKKISYRYVKKGRSKYTKHNPTFPPQTSAELLWLLGVYQGDGYFEKNTKGEPIRVYFAVPPQDRARQKLEVAIKSIFNLPIKPKGICVTIPSVAVGGFIKHLGFSGTAKTKRVPTWVFELPRDQKLAFIQGYLDSDGSLVHQKEKDGILFGQITFASVNKPLLEDMKLLMISAGLNPLNIATYTKFRKLILGKEYKYYTCHFLTLNIRGNLNQILSKQDQTCYLEFVRVWEIEKGLSQPVYDLEIEGAHNFIANGIVVHNSKLTMKYPSFILAGKGARGETLSMALAGEGQHQDTGSKAIHLAPYTTSTIISKSISKGGGRTSYRGMVNIGPNAHHAKSKVVCDALLLDEHSRSDTYPTNRILNSQVSLEHEASVSKIGEEQLFYLMSRGLSEEAAAKMIVSGFVAPLIKRLPLEYAVEMNRLIDMEMEGSIG